MTFPPKVLGLVTSCEKCPNYRYYSGGVYRCGLIEEDVLDKSAIAPFCPLPNYPSRTIADMQMTISALREPLKYGFGVALMTHIAAKLKLDLHAGRPALSIPFKDKGKDRKAYLDLNFIVGIEMPYGEVTFKSDGKTFKLSADSVPLILREMMDKDGELWAHHELAS